MIPLSHATPMADVARSPGSVVEDVHVRRGRELWSLARGLDLTDDEASDAAQEALVRLWSALTRGDRISNPDAWAFRVTYRLAMDHHRGRRALRQLVGRLGSNQGHPAARDPTDRIAVWGEVDRLPPRQRAVLYLRYRAELSFEDIGQALGISPEGARSNGSAALATLRRRLRPADGEP